MKPLEFIIYKIMSSAKRDNFIFSFPILIPFISLSYLNALERISGTMLKRSGESGHLFLVSNLRGKALSLSALTMMLPMCLSYMVFIMLRQISFLPRLFYKLMLNFVKCLSVSMEMIHMIFYVILLLCVSHLLIFM